MSVTLTNGFTYISTTHWINSSGGNWSVGSNWNTGATPSTGDAVYIDASGTYTVNLDVSPTVDSITLGGATGTQTLVIPSTLTLNGPDASSVTTNGILSLTGVLTGGGTLNVNGTLNWTSGGVMSASGITNVAAGATMNLSPSVGYLDTRTLNLSGNTVYSGGGTIRMQNGATINNLSGAIFDAQSDGNVVHSCCSGGNGGFNNAGTFKKSAGTGSTTILGSVAFNNVGVVQADSGAIAMQGGGTSSGTFTANSASSTIQFDGGTQNVALSG